MIVDPENGPMIGTVRGCCSDGASCSCWESMSGGMIVPMTFSFTIYFLQETGLCYVINVVAVVIAAVVVVVVNAGRL